MKKHEWKEVQLKLSKEKESLHFKNLQLRQKQHALKNRVSIFQGHGINSPKINQFSHEMGEAVRNILLVDKYFST